MAGSDYVPGPDPEFDNWQRTMMAWLGPHTAAVGINAPIYDGLQASQGLWNTAYENHQTAQNAAQAASAAKDSQRAEYVRLIREAVRLMQANPGTTNEHRESLGITVKDTIATPVGAPTTRPVAVIRVDGRLVHIIEFRDIDATGKAKPKGVQGAEIYGAVGTTPPANLNGYAYWAMDTATPYRRDYDVSEAGKTAYILMRWVNAKGQPGPWSDVVSATIVG